MADFLEHMSALWRALKPDYWPKTPLDEIVSTNAALATRYESATAVFTGATHGVGMGTLRAFAKHIPIPTAIIIGRSRERFENELRHLQIINEKGRFIFIEAEIGLMKEVDAVCAQIDTLLPKHNIDIVCMSQGTAPVEGRKYTKEGIDLMMALVYYGRVRMAQNLIRRDMMKHDARVISILLGANEGKIYENDLSLVTNYSPLNLRGQVGSTMTLSFDRLSEQNPSMGFTHAYPGRVNTGLIQRSVNGTFAWLFFRYVFEPLVMLGAMSLDQGGERMLWIATNPQFDKGSYSVDWDGGEGSSARLQQYRQNTSLCAQIYEHNELVFGQATGLDAASHTQATTTNPNKAAVASTS